MGLIRSFRGDDRAAVVALWREVFPGEPARNAPEAVIDAKLRVQPELFLVAELDAAAGTAPGELVGTVLGGYDGFRGWAYHLAVAKAQRRRGLGRALMSELETRLAALGCTKLNLQVRVGNDELIGFYRRLGYDLEDRASLARVLS